RFPGDGGKVDQPPESRPQSSRHGIPCRFFRYHGQSNPSTPSAVRLTSVWKPPRPDTTLRLVGNLIRRGDGQVMTFPTRIPQAARLRACPRFLIPPDCPMVVGHLNSMREKCLKRRPLAAGTGAGAIVHLRPAASRPGVAAGFLQFGSCSANEPVLCVIFSTRNRFDQLIDKPHIGEFFF
ncbi:MAG: hypothetical protein RJB04_1623, partial [Verrucomicrobiota bacterium]